MVETFELIQYSGEEVDVSDVHTFDSLTGDDVGDMTALVMATKPGPFLKRTIELGSYLGVRDDDGQLIAMAGERMRPDGWTEISAVCTAPQARGRGLGSALIRGVGAGIRARGDDFFLHTTADNPARKLYDAMGFTLRSEVLLEVLSVADESVL